MAMRLYVKGSEGRCEPVDGGNASAVQDRVPPTISMGESCKFAAIRDFDFAATGDFVFAV